MRLFKLLGLVLLAASSLWAQGSRVNGLVNNQQGQLVANASVWVCASTATGLPCSPLVSVYSNQALTTPVLQPLMTDAYGRYGFWVASGTYIVAVTGRFVTSYSFPITPGGSGGGSSTFQINGVTNANQLNLTNSLPFNGLTFTFSNPSLGIAQLGVMGTLQNSGLTNSSITINTIGLLAGGGSVPLGGALTLSCPTCGAGINSIGLTQTGSIFTISNSPLLVNGSINLAFANALANTALRGPTTGSSAAPTFRTSVEADEPSTTLFTDKAIVMGAVGVDLSLATSLKVPVTGSTQCLQAATTGAVSGTGQACGPAIEVNAGSALAGPVSFNNGTPVTGITINFSNPSGSIVQAAISGTATEALLPAASMFTDQSFTYGAHVADFSGATTLRPKFGTFGSIPGTCAVGDIYEATDATAGQNWYFCTSTNTWTQQLNSGASIPGSNTQVLFNSSGGLGASANLTWVSPALSIGKASSATGILKLVGTTSGTVSLSVLDDAGTWTMKLPNTAGTSGYFLSTDGSGNTSWAAAPGGGTVTSVATTGPLTGGTFTTSGTIACATCVTSAAALTNHGVVLGAGLQATDVTTPDSTTTHFLAATAGDPAFRALASGDIPNNAANTSGNAATATAAAGTPGLCAAGSPGLGIAASFNATSCKSIADYTNYDYVAGGGAANVQTATLSPVATALVAGLEVKWLPTAANTTTTPTLNVNGLGAKTITKQGTAALLAGDLSTTAIAIAIYDGTEFQLINPQASVASFQTNGSGNASQNGVNFLTSTTNTNGLTITPSNPSTNGEKFEITGTALPIGGGTGVSSPTANSLMIGEGASAFNLLTSPSANGDYVVLFHVTGAAKVDPTAVVAGLPCRTVSGTTDTLVYSDRNKTVCYTSASAVTVTVPAANSTGFDSNYPVGLRVIGAGTVTFTLTTSTATILTGTNPVTVGASSFQLTQGQYATLASPDNSNYLVTEVVGGGAGGVSNCATQYAMGEWLTTGTTISCNANILSDASNNLHVGGKLLDVNGGYASWGGTPGTSGLLQAGLEGTAPTCKTAWDEMWADSTNHSWSACNNNGAAGIIPIVSTAVVALQVPNILAVLDQTGVSTANSGSAQNVLASTPAAGHYRLHYYLDQSAGCATLGSGALTIAAGWTDATHARVSATKTLTVATADTSTSDFVEDTPDFWAAASSAITVTATYTACMTGTWTYDLHAFVERIE